MPKQLINTLGAVIVVGILVIAVALVAVPLYLQSLATGAQAEQVAATNAAQQAAINELADQKKNVGEIEESVAHLHEQIPSAIRFDTVSALIADAAARTGVTVTGIAPGQTIQYGAPPVSDDSSAESSAPAEAHVESAGGQVQIPVQIDATGPSLEHMLAFLDALRDGPRLLGNIQPQVTSGAEGAQAVVSAFAYAALGAEK